MGEAVLISLQSCAFNRHNPILALAACPFFWSYRQILFRFRLFGALQVVCHFACRAFYWVGCLPQYSFVFWSLFVYLDLILPRFICWPILRDSPAAGSTTYTCATHPLLQSSSSQSSALLVGPRCACRASSIWGQFLSLIPHITHADGSSSGLSGSRSATMHSRHCSCSA